jgi:hypothetical protein
MTVLRPFIRDLKLKDGVSNATINRALEVVRRILNVAPSGLAMAQRGAEGSDAAGIPAARALLETREGGPFDRCVAHPHEAGRGVCARDRLSSGRDPGLEWTRVDLTRKVAWLDHGTSARLLNRQPESNRRGHFSRVAAALVLPGHRCGRGLVTANPAIDHTGNTGTNNGSHPE